MTPSFATRIVLWTAFASLAFGQDEDGIRVLLAEGELVRARLEASGQAGEVETRFVTRLATKWLDHLAGHIDGLVQHEGVPLDTELTKLVAEVRSELGNLKTDPRERIEILGRIASVFSLLDSDEWLSTAQECLRLDAEQFVTAYWTKLHNDLLGSKEGEPENAGDGPVPLDWTVHVSGAFERETTPWDLRARCCVRFLEELSRPNPPAPIRPDRKWVIEQLLETILPELSSPTEQRPMPDEVGKLLGWIALPNHKNARLDRLTDKGWLPCKTWPQATRDSMDRDRLAFVAVSGVYRLTHGDPARSCLFLVGGPAPLLGMQASLDPNGGAPAGQILVLDCSQAPVQRYSVTTTPCTIGEIANFMYEDPLPVHASNFLTKAWDMAGLQETWRDTRNQRDTLGKETRTKLTAELAILLQKWRGLAPAADLSLPPKRLAVALRAVGGSGDLLTGIDPDDAVLCFDGCTPKPGESWVVLNCKRR